MKPEKTKIIPLGNNKEKTVDHPVEKVIKKSVSHLYFDSLKEIDELLNGINDQQNQEE